MRSIVMARIWMLAVATIVSVASGFGTAVAQEQAMPGSMDPRTSGAGMPTGPGATCRMGEHIDGQLAYLKTELKITDAQTPQWIVFANAFRADKEKNARLCKTTENEESRLKIDVRQPSRIARDDGSALDGAARIITRDGDCGTAALCDFEPGAKKDRRRDHEGRIGLLSIELTHSFIGDNFPPDSFFSESSAALHKRALAEFRQR